jgi:SAM-dependent methyltransferase
MSDVLGQAIHDFYHQKTKQKLWIHNRYGAKEEMPVDTYLRDEDDMPDLEWVALNACQGKVLDIGAGAGSHALALQQKSIDVTAMEISPLAAQVMQKRGVQKVVVADVFQYQAETYDTLLLMMNGIGLSGSISGLRSFLRHAKSLLKPGGQLLFDSSNVAYIYNDDKPADRYYGEIAYQYCYGKECTDWFTWLYVDEQTMHNVAADEGWQSEVLYEDEFGQYLAKLWL